MDLGFRIEDLGFDVFGSRHSRFGVWTQGVEHVEFRMRFQMSS